MANSGSKSIAVTKWDTLKFTWTLSSQSVANNSSVIAWKTQLITTGYGRIDSTRDKTWSVTVNGNKYSGTNKIGIGNNSTKTLTSGTTTITHNDDGTKSFSYSFSQEFDIDFSDEHIDTISGSGNGTLPTIARASQPSLVTWPETTNDVGDFGVPFSIHMNRASDAFTHTVRYEYGSRTGTIATGVTTGTTWAVPLTFMNDIPNATSASGRIYVDTYNGSTLIGTKYTGFTVTVPASVKPSLSVILDDVTGTDDIYGYPVKGLSKIKITPTATTIYSSPIVSYAITANGVTYNSSTATTNVLTTAGSSKVVVTVTDGRGRSATWSYTMTVLDYTAPTVSGLTVKRCDASGTENDQGEYVQITFSAAIASMSGKNTAAYSMRYKKPTDTTWTNVTFNTLANKYTVTNQTYVFSADGNYSYDVELVATDRHSTTTRSTSVSTAFTLYNCHESGTGWRFGGVADKENTLQNDLALCQVGNTYAFQPDSFGGEKGYICIARITLSTLNVNAPIVFIINRRGGLCPMAVYVRFASSSTTTDPDLASITYEGDNFGAFMVKDTTSTWKLYVDNTGGWSNPCLQSWYTTENQKARLVVTFPNEMVAGTEPNALGTYYRATPAKMQSILDFIYPVGSIYLSYNHTNPGTLFGGTWERIENAFLWATDASGTIGQTGGEKTHTLTVDEMPSHQHTLIRPQWYSSDGTEPLSTQHGTSSIYGTTASTTKHFKATVQSNSGIQAVGGGGAHNNMPPYIQVSVWRRTA